MPEIVRSPWRPAIRSLPAGEFVAAIGDVHGQDDLFVALQDEIAQHVRELAPERALVVQLGDLIDRGPGSRRALIAARRGIPGVETVTLRGNHEELLLEFLADPDLATLFAWIANGGHRVLTELGLDVAAVTPEALRDALGEDLIAFMAAAPIMRRVGALLFVHAGIVPGRPLAAQSPHDLVWIREPWLSSTGPYPENVAVIHGHTPVPTISLDHPHRINLDTGAFATGCLSALAIHGDRMRLIQAWR